MSRRHRTERRTPAARLNLGVLLAIAAAVGLTLAFVAARTWLESKISRDAAASRKQARLALFQTTQAQFEPGLFDDTPVPPWWDWWPLDAAHPEYQDVPPTAPWLPEVVWYQRRSIDPLRVAAIIDDVEAIDWLIERGIPVDGVTTGPAGQPQPIDSTPLSDAVAHGQVRAAARLIAHGADIEATPWGASPLMVAAGAPSTIDGDHLGCVELLLDAGADPDRKTSERERAIFHALGIAGSHLSLPPLARRDPAVFGERASVVRPRRGGSWRPGRTNLDPKWAPRFVPDGDALRAAMLFSVTSIDVSDEVRMQSTMRQSIIKTDPVRWTMLYNAYDVASWDDAACDTLLLEAIGRGTAEMVERLIADRGDRPLPTRGPWPHQSLLRLAVDSAEDVGVKCRALLAAGARRDDLGLSLLPDAIRDGDGEAVSALLEIGCRALDEPHGQSPPFIAARSGDAASLAVLLDADPGAVNRRSSARRGNGVTLLQYAAASSRQSAEKVALLIERGADIHVPLEDGTTSVIIAARAANFDAMRMLIEAGADPFSIDLGAPAIVWHPFHRGVPGGTLLHLVARNGPDRRFAMPGSSREAIDFLVGKGLDVDAQTPDGLTPLLIALRDRVPEVPEALLDAGADGAVSFVKIEREGEPVEWRVRRTARRLAIEWRRTDLVRRIIEAGARPSAADGYGTDDLEYAAAQGDALVVRVLVEAGADPSRSERLRGGPDSWLNVFVRRPVHDAIAAYLESVMESAGVAPTAEVED